MPEDYVPWSDTYRTGIRLIDNDHRSLFSTVNALHEKIENKAPVAELRQVTGELLRYANEHFEREEQLMFQYGYPALSAHRKKHHDFIRMVYAIRKIEHDNPDRLDFDRLLAFLAGWLKRHIMGEDRGYIPYLTGDANRRATDWLHVAADESDGSDDPEHDDEVSVTVKVRLSRIPALRRCARILNAGGEKAEAIETLTDPIKEMDFEDAIRIAEIVLKD